MGTVGEIVARGVGVMQGYWKREKEARDAFRDGWLRSGDMRYADDEGYLFIVDRRHAAMASCAVIGIPSERWGEQVRAVVVLRERMRATVPELRDHCREYIPGYKCPASVEFRDALPVSGAGKFVKQELRAPYWEGKSRNVGRV